MQPIPRVLIGERDCPYMVRYTLSRCKDSAISYSGFTSVACTYRMVANQFICLIEVLALSESEQAVSNLA